ncbi:hypothetical protein P7K49_026771 [Saguinus oedipus]|uniref:Uncharacterized protein n=1 Tax=Saguinus oedipus TaxID=9490 RepID=A0ABQ9UF51_SAGOE|nr:hypothetical protein P7K49_026771 [Saguinus oedipus]
MVGTHIVRPDNLRDQKNLSNKHPFVDSNLLYQFRMNFRRRRRLMELLNEKSSSSQETHDSPFCLRKQSHDNRKSTSFMSVESLCALESRDCPLGDCVCSLVPSEPQQGDQDRVCSEEEQHEQLRKQRVLQQQPHPQQQPPCALQPQVWICSSTSMAFIFQENFVT